MIDADALRHFQDGVEAYKAGDFEKAVQELESATQIDHQDYKAFCYLGAAYAAKGRHNSAIGAFKAAEQIAPDVASIHYNIAQAYEASGVPEEAEWEYQRAIELNPSYAKATQALEKIKKRL